MENLWTPWRMEYILGKKDPWCIFCPEAGGQSDEERLILHRGPRVMVMMNKFPYNNGHLLVAPWRHTAVLDDLSGDEMLDLMTWVRRATQVLKRAMHPDGFNVGANLGQVAGAGIASHLHFHVVPRWRGDTSFIAVLGEVRLIPEYLRESYARLLPHFTEAGAAP